MLANTALTRSAMPTSLMPRHLPSNVFSRPRPRFWPLRLQSKHSITSSTPLNSSALHKDSSRLLLRRRRYTHPRSSPRSLPCIFQIPVLQEFRVTSFSPSHYKVSTTDSCKNVSTIFQEPQLAAPCPRCFGRPPLPYRQFDPLLVPTCSQEQQEQAPDRDIQDPRRSCGLLHGHTQHT